MAAEYNTKASNQGLTPAEMSASVGNLVDPTNPPPLVFSGEEWFGFDLAAVGFGFHHFEDPVQAATRLAERLKIGGVLLIIDFLPHGPFDEDASAEVKGEDSGHGQGHSHCLVPHNGHDHDSAGSHLHFDPKASGTVNHLGFSEDTMRQAFEAAGVSKDFAYQEVARGVVFTMKDRSVTRHVFFARGTKV
jgi:SAM-dependent methyltransferase